MFEEDLLINNTDDSGDNASEDRAVAPVYSDESGT